MPVRSYIETWATANDNIQKNVILTKHVETIKKRIVTTQNKMSVTLALQLFLYNGNSNDYRMHVVKTESILASNLKLISAKLFVSLVRFFHDHQCIDKTTVLD